MLFIYFVQHRLTQIVHCVFDVVYIKYDASIVNISKPKGQGVIELLLHDF